jgi:hypothetical protein
MVGVVMSFTVTKASQLDELPLPSVTVTITEIGDGITSAQSKSVLEATMVKEPSGVQLSQKG